MFIDTLLTLLQALTFIEVAKVIAVSASVFCILMIFLVIFLKCHIALYGNNDKGLDTLDANVERWRTIMKQHHDDTP